MGKAAAKRIGPAPGEQEEASAAALEAARRLFAGPCTFITGAADVDGLPEAAIPEVAFAGRSNVGKSSLINALTGRNTLARISNTPGRTRQINFFDLAGRLMLVDLPGYGYAAAPKGVVKEWTRLAEAYLKGRANLRRACLLIDARRGIMKADEAVMAALDIAALSYVVVLTKADKLKPDARRKRLEELNATLKGHVAAYPEVVVTSAHKGEGIAELRAHMAALSAPAPTHCPPTH